MELFNKFFTKIPTWKLECGDYGEHGKEIYKKYQTYSKHSVPAHELNGLGYLLLCFPKLFKISSTYYCNRKYNIIEQATHEESTNTVIPFARGDHFFFKNFESFQEHIEWYNDLKELQLTAKNLARASTDTVVNEINKKEYNFYWLGNGHIYSTIYNTLFYYNQTNTDITTAGVERVIAPLINALLKEDQEKTRQLLGEYLPKFRTFTASKEEIISSYKNTIKEELFTNEDILFVQNLLLTVNLERSLKESLQKTIVNLEKQMNELQKTIQTKRDNYITALYKKEFISSSITQSVLQIKETLTTLKNQNKIKSFTIDTPPTYPDLVRITFTTEVLPIPFLDMGLLKSIVTNDDGYWHNRSAVRSWAKKIVENEDKYTYAISPTKVSILLDLAKQTFSEGYRFNFQTTDLFSKVYNGHAMYNSGSGCLGNFDEPMRTALEALNFKKFIYLTIQYLQSISPQDWAGRNTIQNPLILEYQEDGSFKVAYDYYDKVTGKEVTYGEN